MAISMPRTKLTITMKTTFNDRNDAEDVDNNKLVMMRLEGIKIGSLSNHDDDAEDNVD